MIKSKQVLALILCLSVLIGCGKVTQVTKESDQPKSFDLKYNISMSQRGSAIGAQTTGQGLAKIDSTVFTRIVGIKDSGQQDELSWGKVVLAFDKEKTAERKKAEEKKYQDAIKNKKTYKKKTIETVYTSTAYRKDGIKMTKSDFSWSMLTFSKDKWTGNSKKIRFGYSVYLVSVYTQQGKYFFKVIDEKEVAKKASFDAGEITAYDHFIARIYLTDLAQAKAGTKDTVSIAMLNDVFSTTFFSALNYKKEANTIKRFDVKRPVFKFEKGIEKTCVDIANLVASNEKEEAKALANKTLAKLLTKDAFKNFIAAIDAYKINTKDDKNKDK